MRYQPIDPKLFISNRQKLAKELPADSLVILVASTIIPRGGDAEYPFHQQPNFFWSTGLEEPDDVLILLPSHSREDRRAILFAHESSDFEAGWTGPRLKPSEKSGISGIKTIRSFSDLDKFLPRLIERSKQVYVDLPSNRLINSAAWKMWERLEHDFPLANYQPLHAIMADLRVVKQEPEIKALKQAINITAQGLKAAMKVAKPGAMEYEVEAELIHQYIMAGSSGHGFDPIVASGPKTCIIHSMQNDRTLGDGELVLIDTSAEYGNYPSDISRTWPVNGRFSKRQRAVYDAVLRIQQTSIKFLRPGVNLDQFEDQMGELMNEELIDLGLYKSADVKKQDPSNPLYRRYWNHASHYLGLEVHDIGDRSRPMEAGMVLTCEPGIYIKKEGIGIRLEDDILITKDGSLNLSADIPIDPDEIEALMEAK